MIEQVRRRQSSKSVAASLSGFEQSLVNMSARLINLQPEQIDMCVDDVLRELVLCLGFDRSSVGEFSGEQGHGRITHSWAKFGVKPMPVGFNQRDLPWFAARLFNGELVKYSRPDELPAAAIKERQVIRDLGQTAGLVVPLMVGKKVIGALGVGTVSEEIDWTGELVSRVKLVAGVVANALIRKRKEDELTEYSHRLKFERLLSDLSGMFTYVTDDEVDSHISDALQKIVDSLAVDRVGLYRLETEGFIRTHWAAQTGIPAAPEMIPFHNLSYLREAVESRKPIVISRLGELPDNARAEQEMFEKAGVKSFVMIPLVIGGTILGTLGLVSMRRERNWHPGLIRRLEIVAAIFSNALARRRSKCALDQKNAQLDSIYNSVSNLFLYLSRDGTIIDIKGEAGSALFGSEHSMLGQKVATALVEPLGTQVAKAVEEVAATDKLTVIECEVANNGQREWIEVRLVPLDEHELLAIMCDISDRRQAQLASELQRRLLKSFTLANDVSETLSLVLAELAEFCDWEYAEAWIPDYESNSASLIAHWQMPNAKIKAFARRGKKITFSKGEGMVGRVWESLQPDWCDHTTDSDRLGSARIRECCRAGIEAGIGIPVHINGELLAVFCFYTTQCRTKNLKSVEFISSATMQVAAAIQSRLATEHYRHVLDFAPCGMLLTSKHGTILYQNENARKLLGFMDSELMGRSVKFLFPEGFPSGQDGLPLAGNKKRTGWPQTAEIELTATKSDGVAIPVGVGINALTALHRSWIIVSILDLREHKNNIEKLKSYNRRMQALTRHLHTVAERERCSIARDLHDDLGQVLTSLKMDLSVLDRKLSHPGEPGMGQSAAEEIITMSETIDSALDRVSKSVTRLRPEILDSLGLLTALEWQAEEFSKRHHIACTYHSQTKRITINDEVAVPIFRMVQECLTNAARHSGANEVTIKVAKKKGTLVIEVSDNGVGIPQHRLESSDRFGLLGMRERARSLGGEVKIVSEPGRGTQVEIAVPLDTRGAA